MEQSSYPLILDPQRLARSLQEVTVKSQQLMLGYLGRMANDDSLATMDPLTVTKTFQEMAGQMMSNLAGLSNPATALNTQMQIAESNLKLWNAYTQLWQRTFQRAVLHQDADPVVSPSSDDKRFKDAQWVENYVFDFVKQSYLLAAGHMQSLVGQVQGLDEATKRKANFYTRQWVDALAPTNFAATNPQVLKATLESGGENLYQGLANLLEDLERGEGRLRVKMTDTEAFVLGENVAATPGKVVFQNELMQLLQYTPSTPTVYRRPLLIVPPWINKYYILDLKPKNSFIKWAVDQGHTVFVISWINPDEKLADKRFDDYMTEGPLKALDAIEQATGEREVNTIGYCIGGTLLACTLAYMAAKQDTRIKSGTYFTCMLDFSEVGDLAVFIDEQQITLLETQMKKKGYLEGTHMADSFNMLRANDLIWTFVVNNYLLGRDPAAFDLLYWNSDSTRMTPTMHSWYLRNMYQRNLLRKPGGISLDGVPIDLGTITLPSCFVSAREDHIAPWKSTYAGAQLFSGPTNFILGGSGHIAGIINPPVAKKYSYWTNDSLPGTPESWLSSATQHEGSWWDNWAAWVSEYAGEQVPARQPGDGKLAAIEDAPGSYVKVRIV